MDAWTGYRRFALGIDPDAEPVSRSEALHLDQAVADWRRTGHWMEDPHG